MKKIVFTLLSLAAIAAMVGCGKTGDGLLNFKSDKEVFAFSAVTGVSLMDDSNLSGRRSSNVTGEIEEKVELERFIPMIEDFLFSDDGMKIEVLESDNPDFANLEKVTIKGLNG
ncbi:hypothetical protein LJC17_01525, partial [Acholeplasma sp. OttesenSCG-928-E16]|nr:hypothetical protein [Acholeplasma sp. OttesenSCG-928-E16]